MGLREVVEYLVVKQLSGRTDVVDMLYEYFVLNRSPVILARKYGYQKNCVRGYIQRIVEKVGSTTRARVLVKYVAPLVKTIKPIVVEQDGGRTCLLCIAPVTDAEDHVRKWHHSIVEHHIENVLKMLAARCRK